METIRSSPETQGQPRSGEAQEQHRQHRASHGFSRDELRAEAREVWTKTTQAARRPRIGAAMAGAAVLAATAIMGISEAAVAAIAGYGVYRMLKRKRPSRDPTRRTLRTTTPAKTTDGDRDRRRAVSERCVSARRAAAVAPRTRGAALGVVAVSSADL